MSKLNDFRAIEREIAEKMQELERLKKDKGLQQDIEFEEKLHELVKKYDMTAAQVIQILSPQVAAKQIRVRKPRATKVYKNPVTGETIETKGGNHKTLKAWKEEYGAEEVERWVA